MSYLQNLSRTPIQQAVLADVSILGNLWLTGSTVEELESMGFSLAVSKLFTSSDLYNDALIASIETTHKQSSSQNVKTIMSDTSTRERFCRILEVKNREFQQVLKAIALQCPVELLCQLEPTWSDNRSNVSRIRKMYKSQINFICREMLMKKQDLYENFTLDANQIADFEGKEVKGRVKKPTISEVIMIDKYLAEADKKQLSGLSKYNYIAEEACVFINQICLREKELGEVIYD